MVQIQKTNDINNSNIKLKVTVWTADVALLNSNTK